MKQGTSSPVHPMRRHRLQQGWSEYELADLAGLSMAMVSMIENGHRSPGPETKVRIARALGCRVRDIFPPPPEPTDDELTEAAEAL